MKKTYALETPGKINLFLEIKGKRADSWHELETLFFPIRFLADRVEISFGGKKVRLQCSAPGVPLNEENLAVRAATAFYAAAGEPCPGMEIRIEKHLPVAGGMAGGSSDAGAVLRLLQENSGIRLSPEKLSQTALSIGSDVPYFLNPEPAVGRGRGELLTPVVIPENLPLLLVPGVFPISAAWAYQHWNEAESRNHPSRLEDLLPLLAAGRYSQTRELLRNDLEPAALRKFPMLKLLSARLRDFGGGALMSGSGSTLFALFPDFTVRDWAFDCLKDEFQRYDAILIKS